MAVLGWLLCGALFLLVAAAAYSVGASVENQMLAEAAQSELKDRMAITEGGGSVTEMQNQYFERQQMIAENGGQAKKIFYATVLSALSLANGFVVHGILSMAGQNQKQGAQAVSHG